MLVASQSPTRPRGQYRATVSENTPLCDEHFRLVLDLADFPPTDPGQFVQIACRDLSVADVVTTDAERTPGGAWDVHGREIQQPLAMLRRPFSLAGRDDRDDGIAQLHIIHRVVGIGTDWMSQLSVGAKVDLIGPLGNRFIPPAPGQTALLVGGGVGIPPMLYLAERLAGRSAIAFCGALTRNLLPLTILDEQTQPPDASPLHRLDEFSRHGIPSVITTDDGSLGLRGFVTHGLEAWLDAHRDAQPPVIYTCGPEPMMKRVAQIALERGIDCQVAVERAMACGMGTCQSCCIRVRKPAGVTNPVDRDFVYRLACTDGPVFPASQLLW